MREITFTFAVGVFPYLMNMFLQPAEGLLFRYAGVGNPVVMTFQKLPFFLRRKNGSFWKVITTGLPTPAYRKRRPSAGCKNIFIRYGKTPTAKVNVISRMSICTKYYYRVN